MGRTSNLLRKAKALKASLLSRGSVSSLCPGVEKDKPASSREIKRLGFVPGFEESALRYVEDLGEESENVAKADRILDNEIYVSSYFPSAWNCDYKDIDWGVSHTASPGTFHLYLQALNTVSYLCNAYAVTGSSQYMDAAKLIVDEWLSYKQTPEAAHNPYVWYDHGSALRANNLMKFLFEYLAYAPDDTEYHQVMRSLLVEHAVYLADNAHYTKNHNHGVMQDQALVHLAYFLDDEKSEEWLSVAKQRLEQQKAYAFTKEMVHVENSPAYFICIVSLFEGIATFLTYMGDRFSDYLLDGLDKCYEYFAWATKPDGVLAGIGENDSGTIPLSSLGYFEDGPGVEMLSYATTSGAKGVRPVSCEKTYPLSGYYFGRSTWNKEDMARSTWVMNKAGYTTKTHKQADDTSMMMCSAGYDLLIDPGWYSFVSGDPIHDYLASSNAHNVVVVDGKSYSPTPENGHKTGIFSCSKKGDWTEVLSFNNMYDDAQIDRHFFYGRGDAIVLIDDIKAAKEHRYSQLFHLGSSIDVIDSSDREVVAKVGDSGRYLHIRQLYQEPSLTLHRNLNSSSSDLMCICSPAMNETVSVTTLQWDVVANEALFVTAITVEDETGRFFPCSQGNSQALAISAEYDAFDKKVSFVSEQGRELSAFNWEERERPSFEEISIIVENNNKVVMDNSAMARDWTTAWYVCNLSNGKCIEKAYSNEEPVSAPIAEDGLYAVKAYTISKRGNQRTSRIVAVLSCENGVVADVTDSYPNMNLILYGQSIERLGNNRFRYSLDICYSAHYTIAWYIYKDGGTLFGRNTLNQSSVELDFDLPGKYTVLYYLKTPLGVNEFRNFEQVIVE